MKILFIVNSLASRNGTERTISDKVNALAEMGHFVTLLTYEQGQHPYSFPLNNSVHCVDVGCRYFTIYRYPLFRRLYESWSMKRRFKKALYKIVKKDRPDVISTPTYTAEYMSAIMSVRIFTRVVVESHTAFTHDMIGGSLFERMEKRHLLHIIKKCNLLIALTNSDAFYWKQYVNNVVSVANPVTLFPDSISLEKAKGGRILAVGRLHPQKRFDRLIDAFSLIAKKYPFWYVDIYGDGDDHMKLQKQIECLGLSGQIHIKGNSSDIYSEYMQSQFLVLSSDYEGFGLVILEAMASGIPVVSTDCPFGPAEIIEDGVTGLLCKMDVNDLASKMDWIIVHDKERKDMGVKARHAAERYKKENIMKEWERAYLSVIDS